MGVPADLLELLRCPRPTCRGKLVLDGERLVCAACQVAYPIVDDVPQLLLEEAQPLPKK